MSNWCRFHFRKGRKLKEFESLQWSLRKNWAYSQNLEMILHRREPSLRWRLARTLEWAIMGEHTWEQEVTYWLWPWAPLWSCYPSFQPRTFVHPETISSSQRIAYPGFGSSAFHAWEKQTFQTIRVLEFRKFIPFHCFYFLLLIFPRPLLWGDRFPQLAFGRLML